MLNGLFELVQRVSEPTQAELGEREREKSGAVFIHQFTCLRGNMVGIVCGKLEEASPPTLQRG